MFPAATPPGTSVDNRRNIDVLLLANNRTSSLEIISLLRAAHRRQNTSFLHVKAGSQGEVGRLHLTITCWPFQPKSWRPVDLCCSFAPLRGTWPLCNSCVNLSTRNCRAQRRPERGINVRPRNESATVLGCIAGWAGPLVRDRTFLKGK